MLFALYCMSASVFADGLTATLQQGEKMTPFYGVDAFKQAYEAADSASVITLSAGKFNNISGSVIKSVKIIGNYGLDASSDERTILPSMTIEANNVKLDGIYFSGNVVLGDIENCFIQHSWIEGTLKYLSTSAWHTNTIIDQCVVKDETAIKQGKNYLLKNSTIYKFSEFNTNTNIAYITNCVIYQLCYNHGSPKPTTGTGEDYSPSIPKAVYKNNIIGTDVTNYTYANLYCYYVIHFTSPSEFYGNAFANIGYCFMSGSQYQVQPTRSNMYVFDSGCQNSSNTTFAWKDILTSNQYPSTPKNPGNGQDGTIRGPYGGTGFKLYPAIPRIISKTIDSSTDAEGKVNVKLTVKIEP